jgi:hypothetical protein
MSRVRMALAIAAVIGVTVVGAAPAQARNCPPVGGETAQSDGTDVCSPRV